MPRSLPRTPARVTVLATLALLTGAAAQATMLLPVSLEEITERADLVVRGTVLSAEGRADERFGMVFTHVTVKVDEALQGSFPDGTVEVVVPGGIDGQRWSQVDGAPELGDRNQDVVLFLYGERGGRMSNVVFWQGLYHVDEGIVRQTGEPVGTFLRNVRTLLRKPSDSGGPDAAAGPGVSR